MRILYSAGIQIYHAIIRLAALTGNTKARLWIDGRKNWKKNLKNSLAGKHTDRIWFHCASLGEFEQGRPLIETAKKDSPELCIILTFFSPSGYEIRKNFQLADVVCYLPIDTATNAKEFIEIVNPSVAIFVKYEFWYHYFEELEKKGIPLFLSSAIFRPGQIFFRFYGLFFRRTLKKVNHFFVQDENSKNLLDSIGFTNATVTGDTRFDRVAEIVSTCKSIDLLEKFASSRKLIIAGSTWKEDEEILLGALSRVSFLNTAIVIAPHEVNDKRIEEIIQSIRRYFPEAVYTTFSSGTSLGTEQFFILDTIGLLSSVYSYGSIAWIGGGFGKGIHNILEAAAFGNPVMFGPNYHKFKEANDLIMLRGAFPVNKNNAAETIQKLLTENDFYNNSSKAATDYVIANLGATRKILNHIKLLSQ